MTAKEDDDYLSPDERAILQLHKTIDELKAELSKRDELIKAAGELIGRIGVIGDLQSLKEYKRAEKRYNKLKSELK